MKPIFFYIALLLAISNVQAQQQFQTIFKSGEDGYKSYRIPAIVGLRNGTLLAFCEGRVNNAADHGDIDIVLKRSFDNGKTWEKIQVVAQNGNMQAGNPAPVVDNMDSAYPQGRIFLFYNTGSVSESEVINGKGLRQCFYITSIDNGATWSAPTDITSLVHKPNQPNINPAYNNEADWRGYANTPGHALQLKKGNFAGRIFVPANHTEGDRKDGKGYFVAHGYFTDDHGKSFKLGDNVSIKGSNESIAVELKDGTLMMNSRNQKGNPRARIVSLSKDGGSTWDTCFYDKQLIDPVCQATIIQLDKKTIGFCNPANDKYRNNLTLKISTDMGKTWKTNAEIYRDDERQKQSPAAYSDMVVLDRKTVGVLFEKDNYSEIAFTILKWR